MAQLAMQALGATLGAYGMSSVDYNQLLPDMGDLEEPPPAQRERSEPGGAPRQIATRLAGASVGALLAWLAFPPGLDFSLVASSLLVAGSAVIAALLNETWSGLDSAPERAAVGSKGEGPVVKLAGPAVTIGALATNGGMTALE
eukprot:CAMPEP_0179247162 /NCGR_PEP_ID=MMETSP0797-20121207/19466_1 /TAXON_ID=47934 /ORGANISM="Dinophysis acuminata, Strain DAEP01" /LENGTH=143 /DNA_ID=CAMNT_0020954771 /DNA_START=87 /DNA_END=518 /DNA_ORIENTATION=+